VSGKTIIRVAGERWYEQGWFVAWILSPIAFGTLVTGVYWWKEIHEPEKTANWLKTTGIVVESSFYLSDNESADPSWDPIPYRPRVSYRYRVNGVERVGWRVYYAAMRFSNEQDVKAYIAEYPVGKEVEVRYSPVDPSESVLNAGVAPAPVFPLVFLRGRPPILLVFLTYVALMPIFFGACLGVLAICDWVRDSPRRLGAPGRSLPTPDAGQPSRCVATPPEDTPRTESAGNH